MKGQAPCPMTLLMLRSRVLRRPTLGLHGFSKEPEPAQHVLSGRLRLPLLQTFVTGTPSQRMLQILWRFRSES